MVGRDGDGGIGLYVEERGREGGRKDVYTYIIKKGLYVEGRRACTMYCGVCTVVCELCML